MDLIRRHRRAVSTALALLLAVESVAVVSVAASSAMTARGAAHALPAAPPAGEVLAESGTVERAPDPAAPEAAAAPQADDAQLHDYLAPRPVPAAAAPATPPSPGAAAPSAKPTVKATPKPQAAPKPKPAPKPAPKAPAYAGRNHLWIPSLGVNRSVSFFACTRSTPPGNYVYRWGCAGTNNVYLLGHASGVFKPLHDAYTSGRLRSGMKVYYADGAGRTRLYTVRWWKLVRPAGDVAWAWAAQSTPSMTLQTCVGANSEYRLVVRLVQAG